MVRLLILIMVTCFVHASASYGASPIKIGVSLGLTGNYRLTSTHQKNAYMLFEKDINARGGVLNRPVSFRIMDNGSKASLAIEQYEALITQEKVDFVIGPYTSGLTMAIAPTIEKHNYPTLAAGAAADKIWQQGYKNIFGMWTPASRYSLGFLKMLTHQGIDNIVIVTSDEPFGAGIGDGAKKWARALRLNVVDFIRFKDGTKDFTQIAKRVQKASPDVVICTGHYYVGASMRRALKKINWQPRLFFATVSPTYQKYYEDFKDEIDLDFSCSIWEPHPKLNYPGSYDFAEQYLARYGVQPTYHAASAYAAGEILEKAITLAKSTDRDAVRAILQKMNTITILGRYAVDKTGIQIKRFPLVVQWQSGTKENVWPLELQTSPLKLRDK